MTNYEWDAHKAKWCERCKHNTRRGGGGVLRSLSWSACTMM